MEKDVIGVVFSLLLVITDFNVVDLICASMVCKQVSL